MFKVPLENSSDKMKNLLIWDAEGSPESGDWIAVLWRGFATDDSPDLISLPKLVEEQADVLRARYLAWIYELGDTRVNGKRLVDHLELRPGFSYWWLTSLAQKFNISGTSQIDNAIKALALELLVSERKTLSIVLVSGNPQLASTIKSFCRKAKLQFQWKFVKPNEKPKSMVRLMYDALPGPARAIISLFLYIFKSFPLIFHKQAKTAFSGEIAFIDVLVHLDKKAFTTGNFISNYWTALVDKLSRSNVKTNWLHNYSQQDEIPSPVKAQELTQRFNGCSSGMQAHALIEGNLTFSVFVKTLVDYFRICRASFRFSNLRRHFVPAASTLDFWPLFKSEWIASLRSQEAMINCLRISLYEKTFSGLPYQRLGVYIQENQPWEMALLHTWKAAGQGKIIGVPHTTVRYWDLRYFYDPRTYTAASDNILPKPDLVAVNGKAAKNAYLNGGYPEAELIEVEALRFLHLVKSYREDAVIKSRGNTLNVLVCGDFLATTNQKILSWLSFAAKYLPPETSYVLKPHPAYPVDLSDYRDFPLAVTNAPLSELLADCDVVFTSNITSAAVDAY
jgi:surface carbohydrate biosynthesis protein (TIGR04326 family)